MSHTEFFNSYFTGQKDLSFLGSIKGATERERFIAKMLGYERLTAAQGEASKTGSIRSDRRNQQRQVDRLEGSRGDIDKIKAQIANHQSELEIAQIRAQAVSVALVAGLGAKANPGTATS
jgi:exonuclease SbcC